MQNLTVQLTDRKKDKPADQSKLGFGTYFTDHMFVMNYDEGQGWHDARIIPYGPIALDPAAMCLHYAQEVFEGMKAYRADDGRILLFRPDRNMARLNVSNDRLCIPQIDEEFAIDALCELIKIEKDWIPTEPGTSLYIRPFIFAIDPHIGVHPAKHLMFVIILSPVGAYYPEGINPVKIMVENEYVRSVKGGMGFTKTGGNYSASLKAQEVAEKVGYTQVLWLDGVERKYVEEVGTMNVFFVIDGEVITPSLVGTILSGVTRMSCIDILRDKGYKVTERRLAVEEIFEAAKNGKLDEAFGTGTAAVISPIGNLRWKDEEIEINNGEIGEISQMLYDTITGIQSGRIEDTRGWVRVVE